MVVAVDCEMRSLKCCIIKTFQSNIQSIKWNFIHLFTYTQTSFANRRYDLRENACGRFDFI